MLTLLNCIRVLSSAIWRLVVYWGFALFQSAHCLGLDAGGFHPLYFIRELYLQARADQVGVPLPLLAVCVKSVSHSAEKINIEDAALHSALTVFAFAS